jgi:tetratricopeptide (TPR) repeat protein
MIRGMSRAPVACVACLLVGVVAIAHAETDRARADRLFKEGRRYLDQKEYALACTAFEQSFDADPAIGTQLNLALCYEKWGKVATAFRAYRETEKLAKAKGDKRSGVARKKMDELRPAIPRVKFELSAEPDASALFLLDGKELDRGWLADEIDVDPGPHTLEVRIPGQAAIKVELKVARGEFKQVAVDLPAGPPSKPRTDDAAKPELAPRADRPAADSTRRTGRFVLGLVAIAGGTTALVTGSSLALDARSDYRAALAMCPELGCTTREAYDATQDARARADRMTFVIGGGLVVVAAGVYLVATSRRETPARVTATPIVTGDVVGFVVGGRL